MALFDLIQDYENGGTEKKHRTFKDCAAADITAAFFNGDEHAEWRTVDGKKALILLEESSLKQHSSHWEAGAKQNFDTGLYEAFTILYIRAEDYGPKPKVGKQLVLGVDETHTRTYEIKSCEDEDGVFRMTLERVRQ
jgi:hypothetical protein